LEPKKERLEIRRHYLFWSIRVGEAKYQDVEEILTDQRFEKGWAESPLAPLSALIGAFGVHVHFGGSEVDVPVWDLVLRIRTTEVLVVITSQERESIEAARAIVVEKLGFTARSA